MRALLALSHGSRDPRAATATDALLAKVRRLAPDLPVAVAYLELARPDVRGAVDALVARGADEIVTVPLLLTAAYHSSVDVPRQLAAAAARHPGVRFPCAEVLGPDPLLLLALERRLREVGVAPHPDVGVVLAAAGTSDAAGLATIEALAQTWQDHRGWSAVVTAYASAGGRTVAEAIEQVQRTGAARIVVASYVLAPGNLPDRILGGAPHGVPVSAPLGDADEVAHIVLARFGVAVETRGAAAPDAVAQPA